MTQALCLRHFFVKMEIDIRSCGLCGGPVFLRTFVVRFPECRGQVRALGLPDDAGGEADVLFFGPFHQGVDLPAEAQMIAQYQK